MIRRMRPSFYSVSELKRIGFKKMGKNVFISRKTSIYSPENIEIGNNIRIDDYCSLSGKIKLGNHIHIAGYTSLYGNSGIILEDYSNISSNVRIYSESDDFTGKALMGPTVPMKYRNIYKGLVTLKKHSIIASTCVVLPNVTIGEGTAIGCFSLVNGNCEPWKIYAGNPLRLLKERERKVIELSKQLEEENLD